MRTGDAEWRARHAVGMEAAKAKTAARVLRGEHYHRVRETMRERHPCKVKGCKRTAYRGSICRPHYRLIPSREKIPLLIALFDAQAKTTARFHRKWLRELNAGVYGDVT
jgi:hypothetical protein